MTYHRFWPCIGPCFLTGFHFFLVISGLWKLQYSLLCSDSLNLCLKPHCSPILCICILTGHFLLNILSVLKCMQKRWIHNLDFSLFFPSSPEGPSAQLSGWFYIIKAHPRKHVIKSHSSSFHGWVTSWLPLDFNHVSYSSFLDIFGICSLTYFQLDQERVGTHMHIKQSCEK